MFKKIEEKRKEKGISKRKFCLEMKVSDTQYNAIIAGETGSVKKLVRMCEYLNLKLSVTDQ